MDPQLIRDYFYRFLYQPKDREYPGLCHLLDLNELVLPDNLRARFIAGHICVYIYIYMSAGYLLLSILSR